MPTNPEKDIGSPKARMTGIWKPPDVGAGNQFSVLYKSSKPSYPQHLSRPPIEPPKALLCYSTQENIVVHFASVLLMYIYIRKISYTLIVNAHLNNKYNFSNSQ